MKVAPNQLWVVPPESLLNEELIDSIPTSVCLQANVQDAAQRVRRIKGDREAAAQELKAIHAWVTAMPKQLQEVFGPPFILVALIGNFLDAGGQIVFVDPPERSAETSNAEPSTPETKE